MKKIVVSREEWETFSDWNAELVGRLGAFQTNILTESELPRANRPAHEVPEWNDELEKSLLDEMEAWHERQTSA